MFRQIRTGRRVIGVAMLVVSLVAFLSSNQFAALKLAFNFWDPFSITQYRLGRLSDEEYEAAIKQALEEGDIDETQMLVKIAQENGHKVPPELVDRTQENGFEYTYRYSKGVLAGAITGDVTDWPSLLGSVVADFCVVGDLRDATIQGGNMVMGDDYEPVTLGLSLVGIVTSVASLTPAVAAAGPMDTGLSLIKNTNKAKKLSKPLVEHLGGIALRLINVDGLKRGLSQVRNIKFKKSSIAATGASFSRIEWQHVAKGDLSKVKGAISELIPVDANAVKSAFKGSINEDVAKEVTDLAAAVGGIASAGGMRSAMRAMEYADDAKELSRFRLLAARMGEKTAVVIKVLGKKAIKLGKLLYLVITILIAVLGWVLGALWFLYSMARATFRAVKRVRGAS